MERGCKDKISCRQMLMSCMTMKLLHPPCTPPRALLALLLHNPCLSFLKHLTWILLLVKHRDGRAVRTHIQICSTTMGDNSPSLSKRLWALFRSQMCKKRGKENSRAHHCEWIFSSGCSGTGWIWGKGWIIYERTMFMLPGAHWEFGYPHTFQIRGTTDLSEATSFRRSRVP